MADHLALNTREPLSSEIKRIGLDLIDRGLEHIRTVEENPDAAVHEIRKRFKELRALVRIVRSEIGKRGYGIENMRLRDAGRLLSSARDGAVLVETVATLRNQPEAGKISDELDLLHEKLVGEYHAEMARLTSENLLILTEESLHALQRRILLWQIRREDFAALRTGVEEVYDSGRKAMHRARRHPTDPNLHEWRKQVKYLWYQMRLVAPAWPAILNRLADQLHDLSDALGLDHDLAVLTNACRSRLARDCDPFLPDLEPLIRCQRDEAREEIRLLGARIYAEKPKAFVDRIQTYWQTAVRPE